jgi:D-glycero-D-manno-heptose 1,7-bisphosphate phosphatase
MSAPAVYLDRDGTLNREVPVALERPEQLELLPGAAEAVARLNAAGWRVILLTNQSAIARGLLDPERLARIHDKLRALLAQSGGRLDGILYCPHHPTEGEPPYRRACACRKPEPGLFLRARELWPSAWERSWSVGDAERDLEASERAGVRSILVATGKGAAEFERMRSAGREPEIFAPDLARAVDRILLDA